MAEESRGSILFVLHAHLPWVLGHGTWPHGEVWLYEAAAECYVPLLRMMDRLASELPRAHLTVGITPVLAEGLSAPRFREGFLAYLAERRGRAERDSENFRKSGDVAGAPLASAWSQFYEGIRSDFEVRYKGDLLAGFRRLQDRGAIEVLTSAATHGYLPLLGRQADVDAQVRCGAAAYRRHFGRAPQGIWLPECAYRPAGPWTRPVGPARTSSRPGLEAVLEREGLRYFFVDTHLFAGGAPLGTYEDRVQERRLDATSPSRGLSPNDVYRVAGEGAASRVSVFARDPRSSVQVWSADYGYPGDGAYLEFHRKQGMDGLRYWRVTDRRLPLDAKLIYDPGAAAERVQAHAGHFVDLVRETLRTHRQETGHTGVVVAPFDAELFGHWWFEGMQWLEAVLRDLAEDVEALTASEVLEAHPPRAAIRLPEGSWGQGGHHWVWLNDGTRWIWDLVYRAEDRFAEALHLSHPAGTAERARILRQLARELVLLEASDWPFLVTTVAARDYAEARVRLHADTFDWLLALLQRLGDGGLEAEDGRRLTEIEARDGPFHEVDLAWWREASPR